MPKQADTLVESQSKAGPFEDFNLLRIRVSGSCMAPFLQPGDIVVIQRADHTDLKKGAIAAYKAESGAIIVHRFHGRDTNLGETALKLRGDLSPAVFEYLNPEQILGRVTAVQRGTRIIAIDTWYWRLLGIICAKTHPIPSLLTPPKHIPRKLAAGMLSLLQCSQLYRRVAWRLVGRRVRFRAATVEDLQQMSVRNVSNYDRILPTRNFSPSEPGMIGAEPRTFVALLGEEVVGRVTMTQIPEGLNMRSYWAINLIWVRGRYRGAGVGRGLLVTAAATLHEEGIEHVCGIVLDANKRMMALGRHVDSIRPPEFAFFRGAGASILAGDRTFLTRSIIEGLRGLKRQGVLERYRGAGCCDKLFDEL
jgi:hypothetical protein